ncbi:MAG: isocitrate lyase/phosphoenolpyruvate mutase family protein, partial [Candidatus Acidiferrales bacterium]
LEAFAKAGAEVLFAPGLPSLDAIRAVCAAAAPRPVNVLAGIKGLAFPVAELEEAGVRRISLGGVLARAAFGGLIGAAREMKEKGTFGFVDRTAPTPEVAGFMIAKKNRASVA